MAREFGFCYGVDRAVDYAYQTREKFPDRRIFITGEIIHNPFVNNKLLEMGIQFLSGRYKKEKKIHKGLIKHDSISDDQNYNNFQDLADIIVYIRDNDVGDLSQTLLGPNPLDFSKHRSILYFDKVPNNTKGLVFSSIGRKIAPFHIKTTNSKYQIKLNSGWGRKLSSGLYIIVLKSPEGKERIFKIKGGPL